MIIVRKSQPVEIDHAALLEHFEHLLEILEKGDSDTAKDWLRYAIKKLKDEN